MISPVVGWMTTAPTSSCEGRISLHHCTIPWTNPLPGREDSVPADWPSRLH